MTAEPLLVIDYSNYPATKTKYILPCFISTHLCSMPTVYLLIYEIMVLCSALIYRSACTAI